MTPQGEALLRAELQTRKQEDRPTITQAIAEARAHGDLKENAEYHAAREQQSFNEGRIKDLEAKLSNSQIIDIKTIAPCDRVIFGSTVTIVNLDSDDQSRYRIVGEDEADIQQGKISYNSPIGKGIIGKLLDDEVSIQTPSGSTDFCIEKIEHLE